MLRRLSSIAVVICASSALVATAAAADMPKQGKLKFEKKKLQDNLSEGCVLADVNKDGKPDVISGPSWFEAPDFKAHPIRDMQPMGPNNQFFGTNGDHVYDVNGDGWVDIITASWFSDKTFWLENPGKEGLADGRKWKEHVMSEGRPECEGTMLRDLDGDKIPELLIDRWTMKVPLTVVKITPGKDGSAPSFKTFDIGDTCGHGMGVGDVNGDKRIDILVSNGWYEAPEGDRFAKKWTFHKAFGLDHESIPFIVVDLNGDKKKDVIMGHAHDYGLVWFEQGPEKDGEITWTKHEIDKSFSQVHFLVWDDLDGDGKKELITGKRWQAHGPDGDPGAHDPVCLVRFLWDRKAKAFERDVITYDDGVGSGMQIRVGDLDGDGKKDIAVGGKTGTYILFNRGPRSD